MEKKLPKNKPRTLVELCLSLHPGFETIIQDGFYCSVSHIRRADCPYAAKERDHNGLYACESTKKRSDYFD